MATVPEREINKEKQGNEDSKHNVQQKEILFLIGSGRFVGDFGNFAFRAIIFFWNILKNLQQSIESHASDTNGRRNRVFRIETIQNDIRLKSIFDVREPILWHFSEFLIINFVGKMNFAQSVTFFCYILPPPIHQAWTSPSPEFFPLMFTRLISHCWPVGWCPRRQELSEAEGDKKVAHET